MSATSETVKNLILDAGIVYKNYGGAGEAVLGATMGGNSFSVEREIREIEVDGVLGKVKGLRRIITENAMLTVNLKEMSTANLKLALPGSTSTNYPSATPTHDSIVSVGKIADSDYLTNIALVATVSGSTTPVVILLSNALADGGFEIALEDKNEAVIEIQFSAHYDPATLTTVPYEIRYPKIV